MSLLCRAYRTGKPCAAAGGGMGTPVVPECGSVVFPSLVEVVGMRGGKRRVSEITARRGSLLVTLGDVEVVLRYEEEPGPHEGGAVTDRFFLALAKQAKRGVSRINGATLLKGPFTLEGANLTKAETQYLRTLGAVIVEERDGQVDCFYYYHLTAALHDWRTLKGGAL